MPKTRKSKPSGAAAILDTEPYVTMFARTGEAASSALDQYGVPRMTLEELRRAIADACPDVSVSDTILREREAGW
jgi:hypothetical protein